MSSVPQVPVSQIWLPAPATHIVICGEVALAGLDGKGDEADGSGHPHEALQTTRQLPRKFDVLGGAPRRPQSIGPIPQQQLSSQAGRQTLGMGGVGPREMEGLYKGDNGKSPICGQVPFTGSLKGRGGVGRVNGAKRVRTLLSGPH